MGKTDVKDDAIQAPSMGALAAKLVENNMLLDMLRLVCITK